ncbi:hypothetical protein CPC08DRAFT_704942 [Agrocybe pediades]|nr:hypothetical protein CPC08DRAFT_704942 [Agrocybe pediades]
MQIISISLVALVATFSSQVMATPAPQLSTPSFQCSSPQAATIGGHNKVLKCPIGYRCCGPFINGFGSCFVGEAGICPLIA